MVCCYSFYDWIDNKGVLKMKPIKDCEWRVQIYGFSWDAYSFNKSGVDELASKDNFASEGFVKRNWECFAKLNGIKKWRYI